MYRSKKKINNIIFDLGGVVIDLERQRAVDALKALGIKDADELLGLYRQDGAFLDLELGNISSAEFFDELRWCAITNGYAAPSDRQIEEAFNDFLIGIPTERLRRLRELRKAGLRLYVLSNTNAVMCDTAIARMFREEGLHIDDYFDGIVASFRENLCKPDRAIFRRVLDRYHLEAETTLMLDDSEANCASARAEGIEALQIGSAEAPDMLAATECFLVP